MQVAIIQKLSLFTFLITYTSRLLITVVVDSIITTSESQ